jgi:hypothetical protein
MQCVSTNIQIAAIVESYVSSPPVPHQKADLMSVRSDFLKAFFDGFTSPGSIMSSANNAAYDGFLAGHDFFLRCADKDEIMRSFGYSMVSIKGCLFFGSDAGFSPSSDSRARWEVADGSFEIDGWPRVLDRKDGMEVMLKGYLSPEKYYGQRFIGDRKLYALKVEVLTHEIG